jgi:hypothetical protein
MKKYLWFIVAGVVIIFLASAFWVLRLQQAPDNIDRSRSIAVNGSTLSCTDTDGGKEPGIKGFSFSTEKGVTLHINDDNCSARNPEAAGNAAQFISGEPECSGSDCYLEEGYCGSYAGQPIDTSTYYTCPGGCMDGACAAAGSKELPAYIISYEDPNKYCNGADMDSEGYRRTIKGRKFIIGTGDFSSAAERVVATLKAAAGERCQQVYDAVKDGITVVNGVATMPPIGGWAGVSIALCNCKPLFELNALMVPGVDKVVWQ